MSTGSIASKIQYKTKQQNIEQKGKTTQLGYSTINVTVAQYLQELITTKYFHKLKMAGISL